MHLDILTPERQRILHQLPKVTGFYLAGGTALALQLGHRVSVDFDLFTNDPLGPSLLATVESVFAEASLAPLVNNVDELTVRVRETKLTFLHYPFPVLKGFVDLAGLPALSVLELAATKAYTIGRRGSLKDYVDLHAIIAGHHASLEEISALASQKYRDRFQTRLFLEQLVWMDDVEDEPIEFVGPPIDRTVIGEFFTEQVRTIRLTG